MNAPTYTEEQKIALVQGHATSNKTVTDYCKEKKISTSMFYTWQKAMRIAPRGKRTFAGEQELKELRMKNKILKEMLRESFSKEAA